MEYTSTIMSLSAHVVELTLDWATVNAVVGQSCYHSGMQ